ncbi:endoribonuclease Dicer homolog 2-like [Arachis stenosperma]|uniref:endoribonuclease Dicer homolog 2-like n=1 Tax=Arachis stenosperma TaxID=217475 RepID=UPI0025AD2998|nr:endoribonuclease Dicer homolog 2-like [Arachis stenosperma]
MEEFVNDAYIPSELVNCSSDACTVTYYCYLIELKQDYVDPIGVHDIVLALRTELDPEIASTKFDMRVERGNLLLSLRQVETIHLSPHLVQRCRRFQTTLFRILLHNDDVSDEFCLGDEPQIDYLLLPATTLNQRLSNSSVDWKTVSSVPFLSEDQCNCWYYPHPVMTKTGLVCSCKLQNCVVKAFHNGSIYIIDGIMDLNGNSRLRNGGKRAPTYKEHFKNNYGIQLQFENQTLLDARSLFKVKNYLHKGRQMKQKGSTSMMPAELPPEVCSVIMSPISISTIYSFTFIPSIMHRLESLLMAFGLKKMLLDNCMQKDIPVFKLLKAITTKECQEDYDCESLGTLGNSFLRYAATQQLFKTNQNLREGSLTQMRDKIICNAALFTFGSSQRLPGFIRKGHFNPKQWIIPGDNSKFLSLTEEVISSRTRVYVCGMKRKMKHKVVADVVAALIGTFVSTGPGGEEAALSFMNWIGIKVDTNVIPYEIHLNVSPEKLVNVTLLESLLNYIFQEPSLLVEALTDGSYNCTENYQRLEFLGDAVLDYLITQYFYKEYHNESSELLTVMRTISVTNECFALSAIRAKLHEHIIRDSKELDKRIAATVNEVEKLSVKSTFGWELDICFPNVLADIIESLAGAIYVDSGYNKEAVFQSIRPLLEPLITPETAQLQPLGELHELCQKGTYQRKKSRVACGNGVTVSIEVKAKEITCKHTAKANNEKTAEKVASKEVIKLLKDKNIGEDASGHEECHAEEEQPCIDKDQVEGESAVICETHFEEEGPLINEMHSQQLESASNGVRKSCEINFEAELIALTQQGILKVEHVPLLASFLTAQPSMRLTDLPSVRCSFGYYVLWEFLHYIESTPLRVLLEDGCARFLGFFDALSMFPFDITWLNKYKMQIVSPPEDAPSRALEKAVKEIEIIDQQLAILQAKKADLQERASELSSILDSPYSVFQQ